MTRKQTRFIAEYLIDLNATQAAIRAGYSAKRADQQGYENLRKPEIGAAIAAGAAWQLAQAELTAVATKEAVRRQVCGDIRSLFDDHGNLKPIKSLKAEEAALIAGFEVIIKNAAAGDNHTDVIHKVKLKDQARFVEMAMKHFGLLTDRVEVGASDHLLAMLDRAKERNRRDAESAERGRRAP